MAEETPYGLVYLIRCSINGKCYVGQTIRGLESRLKNHRSPRSKSIVSNAIRKYGFDSFSVAVLEYASSKTDLDEKERWWVSVLGSLNPGGYNQTVGGEGGSPSEEVRRKISAKLKGRRLPAEQAAQNTARIKKYREQNPTTPEHLEMMRQRRTGSKHTEEARAKMSAFWRTERALETARRISKSHTGKKASEETRAKMSASRKAFLANRKAETVEVSGLVGDPEPPTE